MRTALDSSVILDVLTDDKTWADASQKSLKQAMSEGSLVIGECVMAEITPALDSSDLAVFLLDWGIQFVPTSQTAAILAGEMYRTYLNRKGYAKRMLPDFLIGAHALHHSDRLLARDRGYYRDYFTDLVLLEPTSKGS
jgi:predicted nucleic acid-binding protein